MTMPPASVAMSTSDRRISILIVMVITAVLAGGFGAALHRSRGGPSSMVRLTHRHRPGNGRRMYAAHFDTHREAYDAKDAIAVLRTG